MAPNRRHILGLGLKDRDFFVMATRFFRDFYRNRDFFVARLKLEGSISQRGERL